MSDFREVKDSGQRREFSTGSVRDRAEGKGRYDLITPIGLRRLAKHYENGAKKYGDRNWEKGQPISCYIDSAIRHLFGYLEGKRDEDHLAAAAWNALGAIHTIEKVAAGELPAELDDVPAVAHVPDAASFSYIVPGGANVASLHSTPCQFPLFPCTCGGVTNADPDA